MPAIASLEDLKAAQKEGLSIYAMGCVVGSMKRSNRMRFNWVDNSAFRIRQSAFGRLRSNGKVRVDEISGRKNK